MRSVSSGAEKIVDVLPYLVREERLVLLTKSGFLLECRHCRLPRLNRQDATINPPPSTRACGSTDL